MLADRQQSAFFSRFVLDKSVKAIAYKGIDATRGPGAAGSVGGSTGGIGLGGKDVRSSSTTSTSFMIIEQGENKFEESEFMEALASRIKKEIEESHASIISSGKPANNEFYLDYKDGDIKGRITVSGAAHGPMYVLKASIDESNKP